MQTITAFLSEVSDQVVKADLHGTILSHATCLRHAYNSPATRIVSCKSNLQLAYDCRRRVVSLTHATKSYHVNRPFNVLHIMSDMEFGDDS